jgi:hypothetical protein
VLLRAQPILVSRATIPNHICAKESLICRKTAGAGGYAINIAGDNKTLEVKGEGNITFGRAIIQNPEDFQLRQSQGERR